MKSACDALYRVHEVQAQRRAQPALPYDRFCAQLPETYETDLTGLLLPQAGIIVQIKTSPQISFNLGRLCITPGAANTVPADEIMKAIARHAAGDWGTLNQSDWAQNDKALRQGGRLFSAYRASAGQKFWVITEADRMRTTVLLPEDY